MNKFYAMQIFVRVAELQSFTRAAESLQLPKGSVSRQLRTLEKQTGALLLQRTTRRVELTREGKIYFECCRDVLASLHEMDALFQIDATMLSGHLRVEIPATLATNCIIPHLPDFFRQYPGVVIELTSNDRTVDAVRENFDCVLHLGPVHNTGLTTHAEGYLSMVNCASPDYLARFGTPVTPEELCQHAMILYRPQTDGTPDGFEFYDGRQCRYIQTGNFIAVNRMETGCAACLAGLGIIQAPHIGLAHLLRNKQLIRILPAFPARPLPVTLLYPPRRKFARHVWIFMEWLTGIMANWYR